VRIAFVFYGVCVLFAFGYALFTNQLGVLFGERLPAWLHLGGGVLLGLVVVLLTRVAARGWGPMRRLVDTTTDLVGPLRTDEALVLALLSGFAEELLFRGALWPHLGLVGTSLLFGLVHVLPRRPLWVYPLFAVVVGLLLGLLREGTQSVWPPVLAHVTVNALNLAWLGRRARRASATSG
jgi:membrane protease YdiL (CAAX protease family)